MSAPTVWPILRPRLSGSSQSVDYFHVGKSLWPHWERRVG